jgi:hypothetical protein
MDALYKNAEGKPWQKVETSAVVGEEFNNLIRLGLIQISYDIGRNSRDIKVKVPNIDMSRWPGYAGVEGEGYFGGELEESYLLKIWR